MDESPQATPDSQVVLDESDDATDTPTHHAISQQVNGTRPVNGDTAIPRRGAAVHVPSAIANEPSARHHGAEAANNPVPDMTQIPRVVEPDMHQAVMMRVATSTDNTLPQPEMPLAPESAGRPPPIVLSRQPWTNRRNSRAALAIDLSQSSGQNGLANQQGRTILSTWHDEQPSDEPYRIIEEVDHLDPPQAPNQLVTDGSPGSDVGAVAGSSPRNPEQAD
ncbi:hypothetical protein PG996_010654 [Apiospora saccharicola]|uniref:Uncharacterized protein n=1 Tax=Apiospora saccharicola TaxID=335842 RepID=A0ABR1USA7_9PEZI